MGQRQSLGSSGRHGSTEGFGRQQGDGGVQVLERRGGSLDLFIAVGVCDERHGHGGSPVEEHGVTVESAHDLGAVVACAGIFGVVGDEGVELGNAVLVAGDGDVVGALGLGLGELHLELLDGEDDRALALGDSVVLVGVCNLGIAREALVEDQVGCGVGFGVAHLFEDVDVSSGEVDGGHGYGKRN